jgi:hypothetical protein
MAIPLGGLGIGRQKCPKGRGRAGTSAREPSLWFFRLLVCRRSILQKELTMAIPTPTGRRRLRVAAAVVFFAASTPCLPLAAQGLDSERAIDTIIGSDVEEQESHAATDAGKVIAAIEKTPEAIDKIRKASTLDTVDIVFLADAAATEGGPPPEIEAKISERQEEIKELRKELEGNAMLFHALDSREVLVRDVLAVSFESDRHVIIYAAAKRPG